ncbi:hypothetical protein [Ancylobacter sp.]|uniref:hypothetical protein n=1 Tax=Ancylobacter sp. TaxID=1872567 RepID=UPI003C7BC7B2
MNLALMLLIDKQFLDGPMRVREHHLVVATAKHVFLHREYGVVFVREAASREDLAAYDLTPLLLCGLSVPGTSLRWVILTPVDNPASIVNVLGKAWTQADGLRGRPDVLKVSRHLAASAVDLPETLAATDARQGLHAVGICLAAKAVGSAVWRGPGGALQPISRCL